MDRIRWGLRLSSSPTTLPRRATWSHHIHSWEGTGDLLKMAKVIVVLFIYTTSKFSLVPGTSIMLLTSPLMYPWPPLSCSGENLKVILMLEPPQFTSFNLPYWNPLKSFHLLHQNFIFVLYFVLFKLSISPTSTRIIPNGSTLLLHPQ